MHSNDFEKAFGEYLDGEAYEQAEEMLFSLARNAFLAGWLAAGGFPPKVQRMFSLMKDEEIP